MLPCYLWEILLYLPKIRFGRHVRENIQYTPEREAMRSESRRSRWNKAACIIAVFIMTAALLFCFSVMQQINSQMNESATSNMINTTKVIEETLEEYIEKDYAVLRIIGDFYKNGQYLEENQMTSIENIMGFEWTGVVDRNGNGIDCFAQTFAVLDIPGYEKWNPGEQGCSDVYFGDAGRLQTTLWQPIYQNDEYIGTVFGNIVVSKYYSANIFTFYEGEGRTYLFDAFEGSWIIKSMGVDGTAQRQKDIYSLLLSSGNDAGDVAMFRTAVEEGKTGTALFDFNGELSYVCFMPLEASEDWYIVTVVPRNILLKESAQIQWMIRLIFAVFCITIAVSAIAFLMWQVRRTRKKEAEYREALFANISSNIDAAFLIYDKGSRQTAFVSDNVKRVLGLDRDWLREEPSHLFDWCGIRKDDPQITAFLEGTLEEPVVREVSVETAVDIKIRYFRLELYPADLNQEIVVLTDITKDKDVQNSLLDAMHQAEAASCAKNDFLSAMSHDIRTPMNGIIGMTAIAAANLDDKNRIQDCLTKISEASAHLLELINEVLDMSRIESGRIDLSEEPFNLAGLLQDVLSVIYPGIEQKNQNIKVHIHPMEHEQVIGDAVQFRRMAMNLISNAVKYTPDGGEITVELREKASAVSGYGCYEFLVQDNGIGMSPEFLEKLFLPFEREEKVRISRIQGTGLGMAIVKNIATLMMGEIRVESKIDKGSAFFVTIHLRLVGQEEGQKEKLRKLPVLVVDDDAVICNTVTGMLNDIGMLGEWADNGALAVRKVSERHRNGKDYTAVLLDWKMPEMDGLETARRIRAEVGREVPIIILTAYDWSQIKTEAEEAGVDAFLSKPLYKTKLQNKMLEVTGANTKEEGSSKELSGNKVPAGKRVLLVEDNELNMEIAAELLHMMGIETESAHNGAEAVKKFQESEPGRYDMILMDIQMPVMNGYDAAKVIRNMGRIDSQTVPVIAVTADAFAEDMQMAYKSGMNGHLTKPISVKRMTEIMIEFLDEEPKKRGGRE